MTLSWFFKAGAPAAMLLSAACSTAPAPAPAPRAPAAFVALPDTIVCVIDRTSPSGLAQLGAKVGAEGVVLFADGAVRPLESVHPIGVIAGYAGQEQWLTQGEPIVYDGRRYPRVGGERRIASELIRRVGEHRGILLFAGEEDSSPIDALYVPTSPGCIFQGFVREDLIRR